MSVPAPSRLDLLADPALRRSLEDMVRRRVPPSDVDDVVQATLTEAIASATAPDEPEALRKWVYGIARHKVADFHRRHRRETPEEMPDLEAPASSHGARDLLRWAERQLPAEGAKETLSVLLRESEGEKLEAIAASEKIAAPALRQRVTRLRKHFRDRWKAELAALAAAGIVVALIVWALTRPKKDEPPIAREVPVPPSAGPDRTAEARQLRRDALARCSEKDWAACLDGLDRAKALDPAGDDTDEVIAARRAAAEATTPVPTPAPSATILPAPAPKSSAAPTPPAQQKKSTFSSEPPPPKPTMNPSPLPPKPGPTKSGFGQKK